MIRWPIFSGLTASRIAFSSMRPTVCSVSMVRVTVCVCVCLCVCECGGGGEGGTQGNLKFNPLQGRKQDLLKGGYAAQLH